MKELTLKLAGGEYQIALGRGILRDADKYFALNRRVFIVTDSGVPREYAEAIKSKCKLATIYTVEAGEGSKSISTFENIMLAMMKFGITRTDCAVAVGGGVVGDITGFAAACYMRGIDFYNVPTTLLAQVDSSIGGKTALNLADVKNAVGAFHQPKGVLIDVDVLKTLSARHVSAGLAEALKMSLTHDEALFEIFENEGANEKNIEQIILRSLSIKKAVVEEDEKESGLRRVLNFGHTFGHGIEAERAPTQLYHGECVALGMIPMCSSDVRKRLVPVLKKLGLPTEYRGKLERALKYVAHDKKASEDSIYAVFVDKIGEFRIERLSIKEFNEHIRSSY